RRLLCLGNQQPAAPLISCPLWTTSSGLRACWPASALLEQEQSESPAFGLPAMPPRRVSPRPQQALGQAIREIRSERGLSQEAVALDAEIEQSWLSHIERGRRNPSWGDGAAHRRCDRCAGLGSRAPR